MTPPLSTQQKAPKPQIKPQGQTKGRRLFDPAPKPKTAARPAPKPKAPPRPKVAFGSKPKVGPPKPVEPRTIFGPKIKPARVNLAKKIASVRKQYMAGANKRNNTAVKAGIQARTAQGGPEAAQVAPGASPPTEAVLRAIVALNEALLDLPEESTTKDAQYLTHSKRAALTEGLEWKVRHHQQAGERAATLGCLERSQRHYVLAATYGRLSG